MSPKEISVAGLRFRWIDNSGASAHADDDIYAIGWAHHRLAVLDTGEIVRFHAGSPEFIVYRPDGSIA